MHIDVMGLLGLQISGAQRKLVEEGSSISQYMLTKYAAKLGSKEFLGATKIAQSISLALLTFLAERGLMPIDPIITTPHNDTLNHEHYEVCAFVEDTPYPLKKSAILYKQMALTMSKPLHESGIYFFQDLCFRGERSNPQKDHGRSWEFTQTDLEKGVDKYDPDMWLEFINAMMKAIFEKGLFMHEQMLSDLFGVILPPLPDEIPIFDIGELINIHGSEELAERRMAQMTDSPVVVGTNLAREFYDKRDEGGKFLNFDILMRNTKSGPFGEIASGAFIRTNEYEEIVHRMLELGNIKTRPNISNNVITNCHELGGYGPFLELAHHNGGLAKTGGFGIGDQRVRRAVLSGNKVTEIHDIMAFSRHPNERFPLL